MVFVVSDTRAQSHYIFTPGCEKAYNAIFDLNLNTAKNLLQNERKQYPANKIPVLLENQIDFIFAFIGEEKSAFEKLKNAAEKRIELLESEKEVSPWRNYIKAEIYLHNAFARLKFQEYFFAAYEFRKAYNMLEENQKLYPSFLPNKKSLGLIHSLVGAVPEKYQWVLKIAGFKGTIRQGINEINDILFSNSRDAYFKKEALLVKSFVEQNIRKDSTQVFLCIRLLEEGIKKSGSPLYRFMLASLLSHNGLNDKAIEVLSTKKESEFPFFYLDFIEASYKLDRLDKDSNVGFSVYLKNFRGKSFLKTAAHRLSWYCLLNGRKDLYEYYKKQVREIGNEEADEDKQALKESLLPAPQINLLKARLLFDGGYYKQSRSELLAIKEISGLNFRERVEYLYRLARVCHQLKELDQARKYYLETIALSKDYPFYFAANSYLQLGWIEEEEKNYKQAAFFYRQAVLLENHEYENSIEQKAKAGIRRSQIPHE